MMGKDNNNISKRKFGVTNVTYSNDNVINLSSATNDTANHIFLDEVSYEQVRQLRGYEAPVNVVLVCDMYEQSNYTYLEYLEISRSTQTLMLNVDVNFVLSDWDGSVNILSFIGELRDRVFLELGISSTLEELYDEDLLHIQFQIEDHIGVCVEEVLIPFITQLSRFHQEIIHDIDTRFLLECKKIHRKICLPKGSGHVSGALLHFLVHILSRRFDGNIMLTSITQRPNSIVFSVEFSALFKNKILTTISDYAEVLTGDRRAENFFSASVSLTKFNHILKTISCKDPFDVVSDGVDPDQLYMADDDLLKLKQRVGKGLLCTSSLTTEKKRQSFI